MPGIIYESPGGESSLIDAVLCEKFLFDFNTINGTVLKVLPAGTLIEKVVINVNGIFDAGYQIALGFPADNDEIFAFADTDLTQDGNWGHQVYRTSLIAENLSIYVNNTSLSGDGEIFLFYK